DPVHPHGVLRGRRHVRHVRRRPAGPGRPGDPPPVLRRNPRPLGGTCRERAVDGGGPAGRRVEPAPPGRLTEGPADAPPSVSGAGFTGTHGHRPAHGPPRRAVRPPLPGGPRLVARWSPGTGTPRRGAGGQSLPARRPRVVGGDRRADRGGVRGPARAADRAL